LPGDLPRDAAGIPPFRAVRDNPSRRQEYVKSVEMKSWPPHRPYEAADYTNAGLPWFDYYSDRIALQGSKHFKGLKSWKDFHGDSPESLEKADIKNIVGLGNDSGEGMKVS
jgi:hypothetical protein